MVLGVQPGFVTVAPRPQGLGRAGSRSLMMMVTVMMICEARLMLILLKGATGTSESKMTILLEPSWARQAVAQALRCKIQTTSPHVVGQASKPPRDKLTSQPNQAQLSCSKSSFPTAHACASQLPICGPVRGRKITSLRALLEDLLGGVTASDSLA